MESIVDFLLKGLPALIPDSIPILKYSLPPLRVPVPPVTFSVIELNKKKTLEVKLKPLLMGRAGIQTWELSVGIYPKESW